jgi:hypothetical protein
MKRRALGTVLAGSLAGVVLAISGATGASALLCADGTNSAEDDPAVACAENGGLASPVTPTPGPEETPVAEEDPPATEPPATDPPATEPPATDPTPTSPTVSSTLPGGGEVIVDGNSVTLRVPVPAPGAKPSAVRTTPRYTG